MVIFRFLNDLRPRTTFCFVLVAGSNDLYKRRLIGGGAVGLLCLLSWLPAFGVLRRCSNTAGRPVLKARSWLRAAPRHWRATAGFAAGCLRFCGFPVGLHFVSSTTSGFRFDGPVFAAQPRGSLRALVDADVLRFFGFRLYLGVSDLWGWARPLLFSSILLDFPVDSGYGELATDSASVSEVNFCSRKVGGARGHFPAFDDRRITEHAPVDRPLCW